MIDQNLVTENHKIFASELLTIPRNQGVITSDNYRRGMSSSVYFEVFKSETAKADFLTDEKIHVRISDHAPNPHRYRVPEHIYIDLYPTSDTLETAAEVVIENLKNL